MTIRFAPPEPPKAPSLSYILGAEGNIRWRQMTACKLTYEENEPEPVQVWVAVPTRRAIIEDVPELKLTSKWVTA